MCVCVCVCVCMFMYLCQPSSRAGIHIPNIPSKDILSIYSTLKCTDGLTVCLGVLTGLSWCADTCFGRLISDLFIVMNGSG